MDKTSSALAAFDAGKLPSTQQISAFVTWVNEVGIGQLEPQETTGLSNQGHVLAKDLRIVLDAYKQLLEHKDSDNIVQEALYHLTKGDLTLTSEAEAEKESAEADIRALRSSLHALLNVVWASLASEGVSVVQDLLSIFRLSLADAAEMVQSQAGQAKDSLRQVEQDVLEGERDALGRSKQRLAEGDPKVAWQRGMDTVKDAGTTIIGAGQSTTVTARDTAGKTSSRLHDALYKMCDRAQSNEEYREALDTIFSIIQKRLYATMDAAADPDVTLSTFVADPTPDQHVTKALSLLRSFTERLCGQSLDPLVACIHTCAHAIIRDDELKAWFDDFVECTRKNLSEVGYVRSEMGQRQRQDLSMRWKTLTVKNSKWESDVARLKEEVHKLDDGLRNDKDLRHLQVAHRRLGEDIGEGLVNVSMEAKIGMEAAMEQATWFWRDLFKIYIPRILSKLRNLPIPRTEYKDDEIEFVLENLDVSTFNILPSHVFIRNITDIDITTAASPQSPSKTAVGTLTHVRVEALQMKLEDVSFWYKDKSAGVMVPNEFTGLMGVKLPEKGVDMDLKVRLIPASRTGSRSRETLKHFHAIETVSVSISDSVGFEVKESNHPVLTTLFKPLMVMRLREALERTLSEQLRAVVEWADGVAFDIAKRREVFEDTGLGVGGSLIAAVWSEMGKLRRSVRESGREFSWHASGTGVVVESELYNEQGEMEKKASLAMGVEPQILSGDKRGPLGTGSEGLRERIGGGTDESGVGVGETGDVSPRDVMAAAAKDVASEAQDRAQHALEMGERQIRGFRKSVQRKKEMEEERAGWRSPAFDI